MTAKSATGAGPGSQFAPAPELLVVSRDTFSSRGTVLLIGVVGLQALLSWQLPQFSALMHVELSYLPQLLTGLLVLILAMSLRQHAVRRSLRDVSKALIDSISYIESLEQYSFIDPETHTFTLSYLDQLFRQITLMSNRSGSMTTICLFEVGSDRQNSVGTATIIDAAALLRSNFRGSDYIVHYADRQFLVLLPDTSEQHALIALNRLTEKMEYQNLENERASIMLRLEKSVCPAGGDLWETLRSVKNALAIECLPV
jgi:GGDEF domain-containing protein